MTKARLITIASVVVAALVAFGAAERTVAASDLGAKVEAAKTAADHEAIAADLESKAKELDDQAAFHRELASHYGKGLGYGHDRKPQLQAHCEKIVAGLTQAAEEARLLAGEHREMAATSSNQN